ncbi:MAG: Atrophin-1 multi-domain protein [Burkholderiaceae bacterium]
MNFPAAPPIARPAQPFTPGIAPARVRARAWLAAACVLGAIAVPGVAAAPASNEFASFERPFAPDSPWNRRPHRPELGDYRIPPTPYHPFVGIGDYSTGVFRCRPGDPPMRIHGGSSEGVWIVDEGVHRTIEIPCWPAGVQAAIGSDGHAEIVDDRRGIIHSFWQLREQAGTWRASQYAWSRLDGSGWPDPAHNHQGARAAGVPTLGGLIRRHEVDDGEPLYQHALAMSLDGSALRSGYVAPAAGEDNDAATRYRGDIPIGSLMMLPAQFDADGLATPALRKVARTLMAYGAAVVDRNTDTRFVIYVEQGARFDLHGKHWNSAAADDLQRIADALRPMRDHQGWLDGLGRHIEAPATPNLLSMRGPWQSTGRHAGRAGEADAYFDSWRQALVFTKPTAADVIIQQAPGAQRQTRWAQWEAGATYRLSARASGESSLRLRFVDDRERTLWQSRWLANGEHQDFRAPQDTRYPVLSARSEAGDGAWIRGELRLLPDRDRPRH